MEATKKSFEKLVRESFLFAGQRAAGRGVSPDEWIEDPLIFKEASRGVMAVLEALAPKPSGPVTGKADGNQDQA